MEKPHEFLTLDCKDGVCHRVTRTGSRTMCGKDISAEPWNKHTRGIHGAFVGGTYVTCIYCIGAQWFFEAGYRQTFRGGEWVWVKDP